MACISRANHHSGAKLETELTAATAREASRAAELEGALRSISSMTMSHVLSYENGFTRCRVIAHEALTKLPSPTGTKEGT
jgi:hypothetical protein